MGFSPEKKATSADQNCLTSFTFGGMVTFRVETILSQHKRLDGQWGSGLVFGVQWFALRREKTVAQSMARLLLGDALGCGLWLLRGVGSLLVK